MAQVRQTQAWKSDARASKSPAVRGEIDALIGLGRYDEARTLLDEDTKISTRTVLGPATRNYYARARIAIAEGKPGEALKYADEAIVQGLLGGPSDIEYHEIQAQAYRAMGRLDEAEAALRYNVRRYPSHGIGHYYLGQLLEEKGDADDAEGQYRVFLKKWSRADRGLPELADAKARLATLERR
jgi:tetratricopeptide (TPR) repeat protein